jgi:hypothetical protein
MAQLLLDRVNHTIVWLQMCRAAAWKSEMYGATAPTGLKTVTLPSSCKTVLTRVDADVLRSHLEVRDVWRHTHITLHASSNATKPVKTKQHRAVRSPV